ncbi:hypothetical protein ABPG72_000754 [Tetrahymena utriculariae]
MNESFQKSFKEINNNSLVKNKSLLPLTQHSSLSNQFNEEQGNSQSLSKFMKFQQEYNKEVSLQDQKIECSLSQESGKQKPKLLSQEKEGSYIFEQNQRFSLDSKIITPQSEFKKSSYNTCQNSQDPNKCSQILIQDEMIYEKNLKKLGTRVNIVLKNQIKSQNESNTEQKYRQNFENARNIISRLLNNSMNRIMRVRQNVYNFVQNLKIRHSNRRFCDLSEKEYQNINDLSHFYSQKKLKTRQNFRIFIILSRILKFSQKFAIFMPTDTFRVVWDIIQVAFTYIFFYFYSIVIFFDQNDFQTYLIRKISFYAFIIFLFDILINLNTAFFDKDAIITQRKLIAKQYFLSSIFITDLVSMLVLASKIIYSNSLISDNLDQNLFIFILNLLIFLKANGISHKKKRFDYIFTLTENQKHISKLINQLASVITVAHIAAIGWYFLGIQEQNYIQQINWLDKLGISSDSYYQKYIYSLYWSITTMTTAQEQKDRDKQQEDKILSVLSNKLRDEITHEINTKILNTYLIFSSNFSQSTLNKLIFIMKEILVNPNEVIISESQSDDSSIYFIQNGIIEIFQQRIQKQNSVNIIKTLTEGQVFGEVSFFSGLQRQASARSVNLSTLYKIKRDEFIEILKENPEDFERFKMMQDQIIFQKEISITHSECYNCKNTGHLANQCPRTHKYFDKQFIILKQNFSIFQERLFQDRIYFKKKKNYKNQYRHNQEIIQKLKQNLLLENNEKYLFFTEDENIITDDTQSEQENDDDEYDDDNEEESQTEIPQKLEERVGEIVQRNQKKGQQSEKIEKQVKSINHVNSVITNTEEPDQLLNLENQIQSFHQNFIYENQELAKVISNTNNQQARTKSFDATDSIDSTNFQETLHFVQQKSGYQIESNKVFYQKDTTPEIQQCALNQDDDDDDVKSIQNNSRKFDKEKQTQPNLGVQLTDYLKSQIAYGPYYNNLNNQIQKQLTSQSVDDHSQNYQQDIQIQKITKIENTQRKSKHNRSSYVKKKSAVNNQQINQSQKELRCSVEQMLLQNIIQMNLTQDKGQSQLLAKINEINQDKRPCLSASNNFQNENIEKKSNQQINSNSLNKVNQKDSQQNIQQKNQQQINQVNLNSYQNQQLIERFSKLLQESQIPLLFQLTTGKSFLQDSQFLSQNSMDYFDKMQNFKKFYPKNNFDQVLHNIKISQQEQKKQKKIKLAMKERRQNIALGNQTRLSIFQGNNNNFIRQFQIDYDINQYKPTYLSYGTKMQKGVNFPKNIIYKSCNQLL